MIKTVCYINPGVRTDHTNDDRAVIANMTVEEGLVEHIAENAVLIAVFDGVGGEQFGYEAAQTGADMFAHANGSDWTIATVTDKILEINDKIIEMQSSDMDHMGMSSTISGIFIKSHDCIVFNVGDSKVFRYRGNFIRQLTEDDSEGGHVITKWLGMDKLLPKVNEYIDRVRPGDIFLVCSDGVSDFISHDEFEQQLYSLGRECEISDICKKIVNIAIENGSMDNCTVIVAKVE